MSGITTKMVRIAHLKVFCKPAATRGLGARGGGGGGMIHTSSRGVEPAVTQRIPLILYI